MVPIKLRNQVASLVAEGELVRVSREHDLGDVDAEHLPFLGLAHAVEQDVVDGALSTTHDGLSAVFVEENGLVLHVNLLFQLQVALPKDENLPFKGNVDISGGADSTENFDCLTFAIDSGDQTQVVGVEEVDLVGVLPDELILIALQFVTPGKDQLRPDVLDEGRLEIIQLHCAVRAVVNTQGVVRSQLHLLKFQIDCFVDAVDKFVH